MYKLLARSDSGGKLLIEPTSVGGANVVLDNVDCDASVYVGAAVRMTGAGLAINAIADNVTNSNVIGIVESKSSSVKCNIRVVGVSLPVFLALDVTKEYYLSNTVAGALQTNVPTTSGHVKLKLGQPFSATEFLFSKGEIVKRN
jgi:hypothetical protein